MKIGNCIKEKHMLSGLAHDARTQHNKEHWKDST